MAKNALVKKGGFDDVDQERLEKAVDTSAGVSGGEMTVVSIKMSVEQRDTFKMYCLQKHIKLSDFYVAACREYMENHK